MGSAREEKPRSKESDGTHFRLECRSMSRINGLLRGVALPRLVKTNQARVTLGGQGRRSASLSLSRSLSRAQAKTKTTSIETDDVTAEEFEYSKNELLAEEKDESEAKMEVKVDVSKVKEFLLNIVDTTDLAEIDLQIGDLELYVLRKCEASPPPAPAPPAATPAPAVAQTQTAQATSPKDTAASLLADLASLEESIDESAIKQTSEKVGTFRRRRDRPSHSWSRWVRILRCLRSKRAKLLTLK